MMKDTICISFNSFDDKSQKHSTKILPLQLAYALTIHKCQGLTLPNVLIDCSRIFAPGQLSVALGRVRDISNVCLVNFSPDVILNQPKHVLQFIGKQSKPIRPETQCCKIELGSQIDCYQGDDHVLKDDDTKDDSDDNDNDINDEDEELFESVLSTLPQPDLDISPIALLQEIRCKNNDTPTQAKLNGLVDNLCHANVVKFMEYVNTILATSFSEHCDVESNTKQMTRFQTQCIKEWQDEEFTQQVASLFNLRAEPSRFHMQVGSRIFIHVKTSFIASKLTTTELQSQTMPLSSSSLQKIYHLAGRSLFKTKKYYKSIMSRNSPFNNSVSFQKWLQAEAILQELHDLELTKQEAEEIFQNELISYSSEREYYPSALTHPSKPLFEIFKKIENLRQPFHSLQGMKIYGSSVLQKCQESIQSNKEVLQDWNQHFASNSTLSSDDKDKVFKIITTRYLNVMHNQFRKTIRDKLNHEKKLAHRARHKGTSNKPSLTYNSIISCIDHVVTHSTLKQEVTDINSTFLKKLTVPQLIHIGFGYSLQLKKSNGKKKIMETLRAVILQSDSFTNTSFKNCNKRSASSSCPKSKKLKKQQDQFPCPVCKNPYDEKVNSIFCEKCECWLHQNCAAVSDAEWPRITTSDEPWYCASCK